MTTTSTPRARSGPRKRKIGAVITALALAAPLASVAFAAPAAVAAPGDECAVNYVTQLDTTFSWSAAEYDAVKAQLQQATQMFEGTGVPATAGIAAFGRIAPLDTAVPLVGVDIQSAAGNQEMRDRIGSYTYHSVDSGGTNWQTGLAWAKAYADAQGAKDVIFITDGVPNAYTDSSGVFHNDSTSDAVKAAAAQAAGDVADEIRAAGYNLHIVFVRTSATGGGGLDDTLFPANPALVEQAMQEIQAGWNINNVLSVNQVADRILESTLADCSPAISLTKSHTDADITDVNGDGFTNAGDQVVFTFVATNTGNMALTNATVTDADLSAAGVGLVNDGKPGSLAVGASGTVKSEPYTLTQADVDAGFFHNVATVKANSPKGPVTDEDDDKVPTNDPQPGIDLVKSHAPESVVDVNANGVTDAGDTVVFDFVAKNTGNVAIENTVVTDPTLAAAGVNLVNGGQLGTLAVGGSAQVKSEPYTITQADTDAGQFLNVATVTGNTPKGPVTDDDDDKVPTNGTPGIKLEKSHEAEDITDVNGNGITDAGDTVVFDLKASNTGHLTIENAVITDKMLADAGVKLEGDGKLGTIAVGQSTTIKSAPYTITQADVDNGGFTNVAIVKGDTPKGPVEDDDDDKVPTDQKPSIELVKSHVPEEIVDVNENGIVDAGDQVVFDFDATNTGTVTITDAVVTDEILAGFDVALVDGGKLGTIKVGETVSTKSEPYTITQADVDAGEFHNVAVVTGDTPKGPVTDDDDDVVPTDGTPAIELVKSHTPESIVDVNKNDITDAGDQVVFDFAATNTGSLTITDAVVTDEILAGFDVALVDGGKLGTIKVGETVSTKSEPYTITQADVDAGKFHNVAVVDGDTPKGPVTDDDEDEVPTDGTPGISIEKSHKPEAVLDVNKNGVTDSGDTVVFNFDVKNTGNVTITEAIVTDEKLAAAGVELVDGGNVGALEVGASAVTQSLPYTITQADVDAGKFVNVASVDGETPRGPVSDSDDDEVPTQPTPSSDGSSLATTGAEQAGVISAAVVGFLALLGGAAFFIRRNRRLESVATNAESQD